MSAGFYLLCYDNKSKGVPVLGKLFLVIGVLGVLKLVPII